jgi:hypothetical protein
MMQSLSKKTLTTIEFLQYFPEKQCCRVHLKEQQGMICKITAVLSIISSGKSGNGNALRVVFRTTLRSVTVMEHAILC